MCVEGEGVVAAETGKAVAVGGRESEGCLRGSSVQWASGRGWPLRMLAGWC